MQTAHLLRFRAQRRAAAATKQPQINTDSTEKKKSVKSVAPKKTAAKKVAAKKTAAKKSGTQKRMAPKKRTK